MNNIFLLIPSFIIIEVLLVLFFLDIGVKVYNYFVTKKAKKDSEVNNEKRRS